MAGFVAWALLVGLSSSLGLLVWDQYEQSKRKQRIEIDWVQFILASLSTAFVVLVIATEFEVLVETILWVVLVLLGVLSYLFWRSRGGPRSLVFCASLTFGWTLAFAGLAIYQFPIPVITWLDGHAAFAQAFAALMGLVAVLFQLRIMQRQTLVMEHQTAISSAQKQILEDQNRRDRPLFRVTVAKNEFHDASPGQTVEVDFTVMNQGHKDSAMGGIEIEARDSLEEAGAVLATWPVVSIQRHSDGAQDFMIRAGDRIRFRGNVTIPSDGPMGLGYILRVRPVLDDGSNAGRVWVSRPVSA